ncbi:MAG: MerR family transcriptional regulator [Chloroflexi bacterium]|nr:MerR family transcriptional regulator [Chloroflexota bacterium]
MTIGKAAAEAGVNVQTIRYYERTGLVPAPSRTPSGYRAYGPDTVRLVRFIKHAQELGFTLAEVEELLKLREDRVSPCADVRAAAVAKVKAIEWKIDRLVAMREALCALIACCDSNGSARSCPILETLDAS